MILNNNNNTNNNSNQVGVTARWRVRNLGPIDAKKVAAQLIPHLDANFINKQNTFLSKIIQQIQISDGTKSWTQNIEQLRVLKTKSQLTSFFNQFSHHTQLFGVTEFGYQFQKMVYLVEDQQFFERFFQIEYQSLKKVASMKMKKRSGGRFSQKCVCSPNWLKWKTKDFIITQDGVLYADEQTQALSNSFNYLIGPNVQQELEIVLRANHRNLHIKAQNFRTYFTFLYYLVKAKGEQLPDHHFRFGSFAPLTEGNQLQFIIDGQDYFRKVAQVLSSAKVQVMITGWWLSPQVYLVRNKKQNYAKYRLDHIIKKLAQNGVQIYILIYWQSSFLSNDSLHTVQVFKKMGENVKIIRHPDIVLPSFWSHHQKLIIVDQSMAFIGGIDLCYGRFDTRKHLIDDNSVEMHPGIEYNNSRIKDFYNVSNYKKDGISRDLPRLPWHDVSVFIIGPCVRDVCNHFIQYWNFASFQTMKVKRSALISHSSRAIPSMSPHHQKGYFKKFFKNNFNKINKIFSNEIHHQNQHQDNNGSANKLKKSLTLNYHELAKYSAKNLHNPEQLFNQKVQKKNKFLFFKDEEQFEQDYRNRIIESRVLQQQNLDILDMQNDEKQSRRPKYKQEPSSAYIPPNISKIKKAQSFRARRLQTMSQQNIQKINQTFQCQLLRSASKWSIGLRTSATERSIQNAYIQLIDKAQHFIYIENQFFISSIKQEDIAQNQIANSLYNRIQKAINKAENFTVVVILPLIPGFAGQISQSEARIPRVILHWQYRTIFRHKNSLIKRIKYLTDQLDGVGPQKYIKFYSLRRHGFIYDTAFTQILYVHSKLMIVDDCKAIIGSANINDRSMNGDRDSQICVLIQGNKNKQITIDKQPMKVNETIHHLRMQLWQQHFALQKDLLIDPLNDQNMKQIQETAKLNTDIYRKIFGCYPDDNIRRMKDITKIKQEANINLYHQHIGKIKGNVVHFPLHFLQDESLTSLTPDAISI